MPGQAEKWPHLLTPRKLVPGSGPLPHPALHEDVASCSPLLLLLLACPLAAELAQLLVQPPLQLGPLGRVQGPIPGPTACIEHSFPADPLPGVGASLLTAAVDLKSHKSQGELWPRETAACRSASKVPDRGPALPPSPSPSFTATQRGAWILRLESWRLGTGDSTSCLPTGWSTWSLQLLLLTSPDSPSCCQSGDTMALVTLCAAHT